MKTNIDEYLDMLVDMAKGKQGYACDLFEYGPLRGYDPLRTLRFVRKKEEQGIKRTDILTPQQKQIIKDRYPLYEAHKKANNVLKELGKYDRLREIALQLNSAKRIDSGNIKNFGKRFGGKRSHLLKVLNGLDKGNIITQSYFNSLISFANYVETPNREELIKKVNQIQEEYFLLVKKFMN